jgi:hypoxanthine phosphoribosyltransferase
MVLGFRVALLRGGLIPGERFLVLLGVIQVIRELHLCWNEAFLG